MQYHFSQRSKIWKDEELSYVPNKFFPTIMSLPLHRELYIPIFHFISYLTDHQMQIRKKRKCERFPHFSIPVALYFNLEILASPFFTFLSLIIWKDLRELQLVLIIFALQQKQTKKYKKLKKIQPYDRKFVFKQYIKSL